MTRLETPPHDSGLRGDDGIAFLIAMSSQSKAYRGKEGETRGEEGRSPREAIKPPSDGLAAVVRARFRRRRS